MTPLADADAAQVEYGEEADAQGGEQEHPEPLEAVGGLAAEQGEGDGHGGHVGGSQDPAGDPGVLEGQVASEGVADVDVLAAVLVVGGGQFCEAECPAAGQEPAQQPDPEELGGRIDLSGDPLRDVKDRGSDDGAHNDRGGVAQGQRASWQVGGWRFHNGCLSLAGGRWTRAFCG